MPSHILKKFQQNLESVTQDLNRVRAQRNKNHIAQKRIKHEELTRAHIREIEEQQSDIIAQKFPVLLQLAQETADVHGYAVTTTHVFDTNSPDEIESTKVTIRSARFDLEKNDYARDHVFALEFSFTVDPVTQQTDITAVMSLEKGMEDYIANHKSRPSIKFQDMITYRFQFDTASDAIDLLQRWTALQDSPEYIERKQYLNSLQNRPTYKSPYYQPKKSYGNWS